MALAQSQHPNHSAHFGTTTSEIKMQTEVTLATGKPTIPVVGHKITDEDIGALTGNKLHEVNFTKIVKLLVDPHSAMLYDRHVYALKKMVMHYENGFLMKDLVNIFKILNVCADRVEEQPMYIDPMLEILKICHLPFLKQKSSDELSYETIAVESISQLGYLMRVPSREVRIEICKTLLSFYSESQKDQSVQRCQATNVAYNRKVVEKSDVSEALVKSLSLIISDREVRLAVIKVLQLFSKHSDKTCDQMLSAGGAEILTVNLNDSDPSGQLLFRTLEIVWNLLENGKKEEVIQQLNNEKCVSQIQEAFIQQLTQGYSHYDRQLRNDLLVIASLVASSDATEPFLETGFAKQLILLATFQEVKSHNALVKHLKLSTNYEDFELKKLLINMLVVLSGNEEALPLLSEGHVILALFSFVRGNENTTGPQEWTPAQFEEIQLHALSALCTLCPLMIEDYMTCQGGTRLLLLLEWCVGPEDYGGHGNSYHGSGGRGNKRAQMRHCLRLMRSVVSTGSENVLTDLSDQGAINQLTGILNSVCKSGEADDAVDVEMQCDMLLILSVLCENDVHRKELFGEEGVEVLTQYMKTNPQQVSSGLGHHQLMLATIDCAWCSVVGCFTTEDLFLEKEGIFLLLDLIENCPKTMRNLILGCLLDLVENRKSIPHITTWRGQEDKTAAHLFCEIWREEERDIGVVREETGAVAVYSKEDGFVTQGEIGRPLMGQLQREIGVVSLPAAFPSQAIVDVSENMRAKIYALFTKLGFMDLPGLSNDDHVTLCIIERYFDFKLGEVWTEIIQELEQEGITPVAPDSECLETISRAIEERAQGCILTQTELIEAQKQQHLIDEQEFYAEIRDNHRQIESTFTEFTEYVSRTSNYKMLKAAKERQDLSIDASRVPRKPAESEHSHITDIPNLMTTTFSMRSVAVESTPLELTGGPLKDYDPMLGTLKPRKIDPKTE